MRSFFSDDDGASGRSEGNSLINLLFHILNRKKYRNWFKENFEKIQFSTGVKRKRNGGKVLGDPRHAFGFGLKFDEMPELLS